jgi:3-phenylpropionate/trans-cinnamate dioxygenase ferredoxin reductase component
LDAVILGADEACDGVVLRLADGTAVVADQLLVAIGNVPETRLATDGGLAVTNGIVVDAAGRTSIPNISAAGDVANQPCALTGVRVRRESWSNAQNQAIATARAALGQQVVYDEVPWNWSDQYNLNIQIVGVPERAKNLFARAGRSMESPCWLALDNDDVPIGAIGIDTARDVRQARKLIQKKQPIRHQDWVSAR